MYIIKKAGKKYWNMALTEVIIFLSVMTILLCPNELISQSRKLPSPLKLKDSLEWGRFESHPAKSLVEEAPILSRTDSKMIALELLGISFDAKAFSEEFPSYFKEYNAAKNEFQRKKLIPGIKEKYQARQRELSAIKEFLVVDKEWYRELGEYSFTNKAFSFAQYGPDVRKSGITLENEDDKKLFPRFISIDENKAERIIENNPSRKVVRYIIVKPTKGSSIYGSRLVRLDMVDLKGIAVSAVVATAETKEVLAAYPERSVPILIERLENDLSLSYVVENLGELDDKSAIPVIKQSLSAHLLKSNRKPAKHLQALTNLTGEDWNALFYYDYRAVLSVMERRNWVNVENNWHIDYGIDNYEEIKQWFSKSCWEGHPCKYSIEIVNIVSLTVVELVLEEYIRLRVKDKHLSDLLEKGFKKRTRVLDPPFSTSIEKYSGRLSIKLNTMHKDFRFIDISYIEKVLSVYPLDVARWRDKLAKVVSSRQVLHGELHTRSRKFFPLKLQFTSFDTLSGRIVGQLEWGKQLATNRIEGTLYGGTSLKFEEIAVIKHGQGSGVLGTIYTMELSQDGSKIEGKWSLKNSQGVVWFRLE